MLTGSARSPTTRSRIRSEPSTSAPATAPAVTTRATDCAVASGRETLLSSGTAAMTATPPAATIPEATSAMFSGFPPCRLFTMISETASAIDSPRAEKPRA